MLLSSFFQSLGKRLPHSQIPSHSGNNSTITTGTYVSPQHVFGLSSAGRGMPALQAGMLDLSRNSGIQQCWRGKCSLPEIGVSPWEHKNCLTETTSVGRRVFFTPLLDSAEPTSLPEQSGWCTPSRAELPAVLQKLCSGVLEERWYKAKLHIKLAAAVCSIYLIFMFPITFSNVERWDFLMWLAGLLFIRISRALALWGAPSQGFMRCASTVKAVPTPKSPCYKTRVMGR